MILFESLFKSGLFAYLILLVMGIELLIIWVYYLVTKKGIAPMHALASLGAGGTIVLAMALMAKGAATHWIALLLILSVLFHWIDLANRWNTNLPD